ncbi:proteinaceous RNase P 1 isoform X2 [Wolffia australiana]
MLRLTSSSSSSPLFSTISKSLSLFTHRRLVSSPLLLSLKDAAPRKKPTKTHLRRLHGDPSPNPIPPQTPPPPSPAQPSRKAMLKARRESPEGILRHKLDMCSRRGDLLEALQLYDEARSQSIPLSQHHYNVLLYLCTSSSPSSSSGGEEEVAKSSPRSIETIKLGLERGFEIFEQMDLDRVPPNEATFTSLARLAAAKQDPDLAFKVIDEMSKSGIPPKLRSYGPALFGFCSKGDPESAFKVESHMAESGVIPEEEELAALLRVSAEFGKEEQVYRLLHRLRDIVRQVSASTAEIVEQWFESEVAGRVGKEEWEEEKVQEGIVNGGGGWHGLGWLGTGDWCVGRTEISEEGVCQRCGEKLVSIDIDPLETENFAKSLASLAMQREVKADFNRFQEWLDRNGPFDAVIDGANVGLANQHHFSFFQLTSVVNGMRKLSPTRKPPLVVLHSRRVKGGPADSPNNKKLLESWRRSGALYATPPGSNDDC